VVGADETVLFTRHPFRFPERGSTVIASIHEGLSGDETIVVAGLQRLRPGAKSRSTKELPPTREALFRSPKVPVQ